MPPPPTASLQQLQEASGQGKDTAAGGVVGLSGGGITLGDGAEGGVAQAEAEAEELDSDGDGETSARVGAPPHVGLGLRGVSSPCCSHLVA